MTRTINEIWHAGNQPFRTGPVPTSNIQNQITASALKASPAFTGHGTNVGNITAGYTASYARFNGVDEYQSLLFKGDSTALGPTYAITAGDMTIFIIWGYLEVSQATSKHQNLRSMRPNEKLQWISDNTSIG